MVLLHDVLVADHLGVVVHAAVPTVAEAGYPDFVSLAWNGVLVPAGTPAPVIARLNREINAILKQPDVMQKLNAAGFDLVGARERLRAVRHGRGGRDSAALRVRGRRAFGLRLGWRGAFRLRLGRRGRCGLGRLFGRLARSGGGRRSAGWRRVSQRVRADGAGDVIC